MKHFKATQDFLRQRNGNVLQWPSISPDLISINHVFYLLKAKCPKNKQEPKTTAAKAWQREETQRLMMSMGFRLQTIIDCEVFANKCSNDNL